MVLHGSAHGPIQEMQNYWFPNLPHIPLVAGANHFCAHLRSREEGFYLLISAMMAGYTAMTKRRAPRGREVLYAFIFARRIILLPYSTKME